MSKDNDVFYWLPCSVVFVSTTHEGKRDIMTATAMFVSEKEPLVLISVAQDHLTDKLIRKSGKFTLAIAGEGQKELSMRVGSSTGENVDKFEQFSVKLLPPKADRGPVPEGAAAWMTCNVEHSQDIEGYRLFIGRVVDQEDLGAAPLVWQKDRFFNLSPV
jgi:flavin reductase (DIM6/NTAB) family NADH-FMN oxidoreductase RutF